MTDDEIVLVIQAHINGEKIECKNKSMNENMWIMTNGPTWNFNHLDYRIKREPRTFYIEEYEDGSFNQLSTIKVNKRPQGYSSKTVKLLEVLDE